MIRFRTILTKHQYSPLNDLEKNDDTGVLRLADKRRFGQPELVVKIEAFERDIVNYFKSRNEDNKTKTNPVQRPTPSKTKPYVSPRTQGNRGGGGGFRPSATNRPQIWSSGPSGTHVDDHHPYDPNCPDPDYGHHHHHHDDDHHHHHHHGDHHHHHHDDDHHHHHHDNDHHHHHDDYHHHHDDHHHTDYHHDDHHHSDYHHDDYSYGGPGSFY